MAKYKPLQYAGCYSLHLYCDRECGAINCGHSDFETEFGEFTGETFAECAREARRAGWKIHRATRTATCRECLKVTADAAAVVKESGQ